MPTEIATDPAVTAVLRRIQGEFREMPGLRLTEAQARRLWGLDASTCSALLGTLIAGGFLFRAADGAVMRMDQATPLKTRLPSGTADKSAA